MSTVEAPIATDANETASQISSGIAGRSPASRAATLLSFLLLTVVPIIVFAQLWNSSFIQYDDPDYIWFEPLVTGGLSLSGMYEAVVTYRNSNWHPVTWWSLMVDYTLFGKHSKAFHLHSLAIHVVNGWLLFWWLRKSMFSTFPSLLIALLFAIHPLHVEPVAWVSSRKDVLSTFFFLCVLLAYRSYTRYPGLLRYLGVTILFALGLMSKSMLVTEPVVMLLIDVFLLNRLASWSTPVISSTREESNSSGTELPQARWSVRAALLLVLEKAPFFGMALGTSYLCFQAQKAFGSVVDTANVSLWEKLSQIVLAYSFYIEKTLFPLNLTLHYPYVAEQPWTRLATATMILLTATWFAFRPGRARTARLFGWAWYVVTLVPVCGLVRLGALSTADRYSYIPLVGVFITMIAALPLTPVDEPLRRRMAKVAAISICGLFAFLAHHQVSYWRNSETIFRHAAKVTPKSARIHAHLGIALERRGKREEAAEHLLESIRLFPDDRVARCILCKIYTTQKDYPNALKVIAEAAEADTRVLGFLNIQSVTNGERRSRAGIFHLWGRALAAAGQQQEAIEKFGEALSIDDSLPLLHADLGDSQKATGQIPAATESYQKAVKLDPRNRIWKKMLANVNDASSSTEPKPESDPTEQ